MKIYSVYVWGGDYSSKLFLKRKNAEEFKEKEQKKRDEIVGAPKAKIIVYETED